MEPEKTPRERAEDLISLLVSDWRPTPPQVLWTMRIGIILSLLVAIGYSYDVTLWDWLKLLIVPAVIAAGGLWFNQQQQERQREENRQQQERGLEIENQRAQDEALQAYLDQMGQLLLDKERPLRQSKQMDEVQTLARARTLTVLTRLNGERKGSVMRFLRESLLILKDRCVLVLHGADLSAANLSGTQMSVANLALTNLSRADLSGTNLGKTSLPFANLSGANLSETSLVQSSLNFANLSGANLSGADLFAAELRKAKLNGALVIGANLIAAKLIGADLSRADLSRANLALANLSRADLTGAKGVTNEELEQQAETLKGATMPDGQKYEDWLKDKEGSGKDVENE